MKSKLLLFFLLLFSCYSLKSENLDTIYNNVTRLFKAEKYLECCNLAKDLYKKSIKTTDTVLVFNSLYYIGFSNQRLGNMDEALEYNMQAYDVAIKLRMPDLQSSVLNNIGNVYMVNDMDSIASVYFNKSIDIERELGRKSQLAVRLGNISTAYLKMGRYEEAIASAEEGLLIDREIGRPNKIAIRLNQLGEVYQSTNRIEEAKRCEVEAYQYFEKAGSKYGMSIVSHSLGDLNRQENKIDSAIYYYEKSLELANDIDNRLLIQEISMSLFKVYKGINPRLAIDYFEQYVNIKDSIFNEKNQQMLNDFQARYNMQEKEVEIEMYKKEVKYNKNIFQLMFLVIALLIVIVVLLVINGIARKRRNAALVELNDTRTKSLSVLSHDLKNPVIAQKLVLHQLNDNLDSFSNEELKMYIDALTDSVSSLEELLTNLLEWTRYEAKRIEYNPLKFDVKALCFDEIVPLYNTMLKKKNIIVKEVEVSNSDNCYVFSDIKMVSTILRNLISNALKFSYENTEVSLYFMDEDDSIRIVVKDNGVGISEEKKKLLLSGKTFTTYGTNGEDGNGIGLEIVNKMLSICESKLHIESTPGKGSEFSFKLKKGNV